MTGERRQQVTVEVPNLGGRVGARGDDQRAIVAELCRGHLGGVADEGGLKLAVEVPDGGRLALRCHHSIVGRAGTRLELTEPSVARQGEAATAYIAP